jgi:hypothetical protein
VVNGNNIVDGKKKFRSCIVCFVTLVLSFVIQEQKKARELYHIIKDKYWKKMWMQIMYLLKKHLNKK